MFNPELYAACTSMHYSDDDGETYETNRAACGEPVNDHQTVFTGPPPPNLKDQMGDYPNVLYYCFNRIADANCGRSLDGGASFDTATGDGGGISYPGFDIDAGGLCGGLHGHGDTDSEGRVFIPKGHCGYPWVAISEDGAETFKRVKVSDTVGAASTHLAVATDEADNVYMAWWDPQEHLPYLAISRDHGETWSTPMMIAPAEAVAAVDRIVDRVRRREDEQRLLGQRVGGDHDVLVPWTVLVFGVTDCRAWEVDGDLCRRRRLRPPGS